MAGNPRTANGTRHRRFVSKVRGRLDPCAICGEAIDYSLKSPDPLSFEADHIVPVSRGGDPYDPANGQASHRCCNNWRKDKSMSYVDDVMAGLVEPRKKPPIYRKSAPQRRGGPRVVPTFDW